MSSNTASLLRRTLRKWNRTKMLVDALLSYWVAEEKVEGRYVHLSCAVKGSRSMTERWPELI